MTEGAGPDLIGQAGAWIVADPDPETRAELEALVEAKDLGALADRFAEPLTFGTAGIRGVVGAGPARMNRVVVRRTTAGLCRWLSERVGDTDRGIVVGRDARHGSASFSADTSAVAAVLGVRVRTFARPLPTPITAFATRHLRAAAGVMITASHNPASDNGYKVYLDDGAQVIPPYDAAIAAASSHGDEDLSQAGARGVPRKVERIDERELLRAYRSAVLKLIDQNAPRDLSIVYTPLHGVGGAITPDLLEQAGFDRPFVVAQQADPDPDFPTVAFPNPEEPGALDLALADAERLQADLVLANDPDADRLAVAVARPGDRTRFRALTGDELGILLADHLISASSGSDRLVATSIVSSSMLAALAAARNVAFAQTLTGFKWLARAATHHPGHRLLFAYEEALGYAVSDAVADKDGMSAAIVVAEVAAKHKAEGRSLLDRLDELSAELGVHLTRQWSLRREGSDAPAAMAAIVERWRSSPPTMLAGHAVTTRTDLALGSDQLPPTDGVVLRAGRPVRVIIRPSGTEPKLKAYLEVTTPPCDVVDLAVARADAEHTMELLRREVAAFCS
jgi:phosphomannomutase